MIDALTQTANMIDAITVTDYEEFIRAKTQRAYMRCIFRAENYQTI
jgi:hypothetical protein